MLTLLYPLAQLAETPCHIRPQMNPQDAAVSPGKDLEVSTGLRRLHNAEGVLLLQYGDIMMVIAGELEENTCIRTALVHLAC